MILASRHASGRDGQLMVVSADRLQAVSATDIAPTLQVALEHWSNLENALIERFNALNHGRADAAVPFEAKDYLSPLPRSFQFLDGSVYLSHMQKARQARGASMPENFDSEPLMYQGLSDSFLAPLQDAPFPDEDLGIDFEAEIAVVVDDVPMGVSVDDALQHIKLVLLLNDFTARNLTKTELPKGFGFVQSKPTSSFAPLAVTPQSLAEHWHQCKLNLPVCCYINGQLLGRPNAGKDMYFGFPELIHHASRTRRLSAGTIIGAGAVSNKDISTGYACIAEARVEEQIASGSPQTNFLRFGDTVKIEVLSPQGVTLFGRIEQTIVAAYS